MFVINSLELTSTLAIRPSFIKQNTEQLLPETVLPTYNTIKNTVQRNIIEFSKNKYLYNTSRPARNCERYKHSEFAFQQSATDAISYKYLLLLA